MIYTVQRYFIAAVVNMIVASVRNITMLKLNCNKTKFIAERVFLTPLYQPEDEKLEQWSTSY